MGKLQFALLEWLQLALGSAAPEPEHVASATVMGRESSSIALHTADNIPGGAGPFKAAKNATSDSTGALHLTTTTANSSTPETGRSSSHEEPISQGPSTDGGGGDDVKSHVGGKLPPGGGFSAGATWAW